MSVKANTERRSDTPDRATGDSLTDTLTDTPTTTAGLPAAKPATNAVNGTPVMMRLVTGDPEPFPYTKVRDWIPLLPQETLCDGAFRLYCISRSVIWENAKGGPPPKPVIEITYEEYASMLGRSARTISRHAQDLYAAGLWEMVERTHRSVTVPGKTRPEVRTVITIRVHDYPPEPDRFTGPVKTWDVLQTLRENKIPGRTRAPATVPPARPTDGLVEEPARVRGRRCAPTSLSTQPDQPEQGESAGTECDRTTMSPQSSTSPTQDQQHVLSPGETPREPGECDRATVTETRTDLSTESDIPAGQTVCGGALKKIVEEEKPSLPPRSRVDDRALPSGQSLADELVMFSEEAIALVGVLYDRTLTAPGLQPLSAGERVGLARRIDARLDEGWSLARVRAVLTGGSLVGVKMPGRLWAGRLDDMPAHPAIPSPRSAQGTHPGAAVHGGPRGGDPARAGRDGRAARPVVTNDCSALPEPNLGKIRYQVPDERGLRLVPKWADERRVLPWCGRCSPDARTLMPRESGQLPGPCPDCHPEPAAFAAAPSAHHSAPDRARPGALPGAHRGTASASSAASAVFEPTTGQAGLAPAEPLPAASEPERTTT